MAYNRCNEKAKGEIARHCIVRDQRENRTRARSIMQRKDEPESLLEGAFASFTWSKTIILLFCPYRRSQSPQTAAQNTRAVAALALIRRLYRPT